MDAILYRIDLKYSNQRIITHSYQLNGTFSCKTLKYFFFRIFRTDKHKVSNIFGKCTIYIVNYCKYMICIFFYFT